MLKVTVHRTADELIRDLERRGLVVKMETVDRTLDARHWHLGYNRKPGVLEVTDLGAECELKVASNRDGGWADALALELST